MQLAVLACSIAISLASSSCSSSKKPCALQNACADGFPPRTAATRYLGAGYNILDGNPRGDRIRETATDPGIKSSHVILAKTYTCNHLSDDGRYHIADQIEYFERTACTLAKASKIDLGESSYQKNLEVDVSVSAEGSFGLVDYAFTLSSSFQEKKSGFQQQKRIYYETVRSCIRGAARYKLEMAENSSEYSLTNMFVNRVKSLPATYNRDAYGTFLKEWGTHVITEATVGSTYIEEYQSSFSDVAKYAMTQLDVGVQASLSYSGITGAVSVDVGTLAETSSSDMISKATKRTSSKGSTIYWNEATEDWEEPDAEVQFSEPISIKLTAIDKFISCSYTKDEEVLNRLGNIQTALKEHASYRSAVKPNVDSTSYAVRLGWPRGTYGLVQFPGKECPGKDWAFGYRFFDTNDPRASPSYVPANNIFRINNLVDQWDNIELRFCMHEIDDIESGSETTEWPAGDYCILKKLSCPPGFESGSIFWDDANDNQNKVGGALPDGKYNYNTRIYFCCRRDGYPYNPIYLPIDKDFVLLKAGSLCQEVYGMKGPFPHTLHWNDDDNGNLDSQSGASPYDDADQWNHRLHFCLYMAT